MPRVLITGGSRGLGLAICRRLLNDGWSVVSSSRTCPSAVHDLLDQYPDRFANHSIDFSQPDSARELARAVGTLDGFDGFVANAAIGVAGLLTLSSDEVIQRCIQVNLLAPMMLAREVIKGMIERGGSVVFISSVAARTGLSGLTAYSAAKGGLQAFSRSVAREYGERKIRSNCVLPGFLDTEMSAELNTEERRRIANRTALRRLGASEEVAGLVAYLLSDEARYVTGAEFVVDGGFTV